ncbi:hypothetical protein KFL_000490320 [Klebsormidium nitens]|uniref:Uncharacterized protein n=1 Tax=Klebsormidium nitens TaxID=105231 RepID=A0A0U9HRM6_KLENI|nr:hypothetical protein KFL_000490320 [Klebsormidium nitens]|eukprot:GAQ80242.1 hypothetical protein KFL_000490320 [Klebsormidium nitens]
MTRRTMSGKGGEEEDLARTSSQEEMAFQETDPGPDVEEDVHNLDEQKPIYVGPSHGHTGFKRMYKFDGSRSVVVPPDLDPASMTESSPDLSHAQARNVEKIGGWTEWKIPCADALEEGQKIVFFSYPSQPRLDSGEEWAAKYLRKPEDYEQYRLEVGADAVPPDQFTLDSVEAMRRLMGLAGDVFYPDQLCISPGTVHKANSFLVEHTATMMPQSSGGAEAGAVPASLTSADDLLLCTVWVANYVADVLPNLSKVPTHQFDELDSDALACLQRFLRHHADSIVKLGLTDKVARFLSAHKSRIDWSLSSLADFV